jgi:uncharacterized protein
MMAKRTSHSASTSSPAPQPSLGDGLGQTHPAVRTDGDQLILTVRVTPRAARNAIAADASRLLIRLTAPPVDGAANAALLALLAARLRLPRRALTIVRGAASREKLVAVQGLTAAECWARLRADASPS